MKSLGWIVIFSSWLFSHSALAASSSTTFGVNGYLSISGAGAIGTHTFVLYVHDGTGCSVYSENQSFTFLAGAPGYFALQVGTGTSPAWYGAANFAQAFDTSSAGISGKLATAFTTGCTTLSGSTANWKVNVTIDGTFAMGDIPVTATPLASVADNANGLNGIPVSSAGLVANDYLQYNGTNWVPAPAAVNAITTLTGDVTASGTGSVVSTISTVGGATAANVAAASASVLAATNIDTASTLVKRDASGGGNFSTMNLTGSTSGNLSFTVPATVTPYTMTFPAVDGAGVLTNNGSGILSWVAAGSGTVNAGTLNNLAYYAASGSAVSSLPTANNGVLVTSGAGTPSISTTLPAVNGAAVTNLNASAITSGMVPTLNGGTGVNGSAAVAGTLLIGNGAGFTLNSLTAGTGISIGNAAGSITITNSGGTSPGGAASGDLAGTYPGPTVAKIQGSAIAGVGLLNNDVLQNTSGVTLTNQALIANGAGGVSGLAPGIGSFLRANAGGTLWTSGALASADITAALGFTPSPTPGSSKQIPFNNGAGTLAAAATATDFTWDDVNKKLSLSTTSPTGDALVVGAAPFSGAANSLVRLGINDIAGGSANGTYIGANPAAAGADFMNYEIGGNSKFKVDSNGNISTSGTITGNGSALTGITPTFAGLIPGGVGYASNATTLASSSAGTANQVLISGGAATPTWSPITFSGGSTMTFPAAGTLTTTGGNLTLQSATGGTTTVGASAGNSNVILQSAGTGSISLAGNTSISGASTFSTGTGAVALNGATTITGNTLISSGTFTTSPGGAVTFGGPTTVAANQSFTMASGTAQFLQTFTSGTTIAHNIIGNSLTSGSLLDLTTSSASLNSSNGLLYVANTGGSTSGILAKFQSNATAGSGLTVATNGNVGVGTSATPLYLLDLQSPNVGGGVSELHFGNPVSGLGGGFLTSTIDGQAYVSGGGYYNGTNWIATGTAGSATVFGTNAGGDFQVQSATGTTNGSTFAPTTKLYVGSNGNVGVGTTTPATNLDVNGSMKIKVYSAAPYACDAAHDGAIALNSNYTPCVCQSSSGWGFADGSGACNWAQVCIKVVSSFYSAPSPFAGTVTINYSMIGGGGGGGANAPGSSGSVVSGSFALAAGSYISVISGGGGGAGTAANQGGGGGGGAGYYGGGGGANASGGYGCGGGGGSSAIILNNSLVNYSAGGTGGSYTSTYTCSGGGGGTNAGGAAGLYSGGLSWIGNGTAGLVFTGGNGFLGGEGGQAATGGYYDGGSSGNSGGPLSGSYFGTVNNGGGGGGGYGGGGASAYANTFTGGIGGNNWAQWKSTTLPPAAGAGGAANSGGGNAGLVILSYSGQPCNL